MTRDEHKNIVNQLLGMVTPESQANASNLLTQLTEDYESTLSIFEATATANETLTANNETLRDVNAKLFLKVGHVDTKKTTEHTEPDEEKPSFDSLFNEKGELI